MFKHTTFFVCFLPLHLSNADWVRDEPSLPYKSHRTINLTSTDHPTILGPPGTKTVSSSLDLTSHIPPETVPSKEAPAKTAVVSDPRTQQQFLV